MVTKSSGSVGCAASSDAVGAILIGAEVFEVLNGGVRDGFHGLTGEKGLMARDDDVGKSEQPLEAAIADNAVAVILKVQTSLLFINIQASRTQAWHWEKSSARCARDSPQWRRDTATRPRSGPHQDQDPATRGGIDPVSAQWIWQRGWKDLTTSIVGAHPPYDVQRDQDHAGSLFRC